MSPNPTPAARHLPILSLPAAPGGATTSIRGRGRDEVVLVGIHSDACQPCRAYLRGLAESHDDITEWDGRVAVLLPGQLAEAEELRSDLEIPYPVLADADGEAAARTGLQGGGMIIADQWGEIFLDEAGGPDVHAFPSVDEVVEWLRYLAIQCPECQGEAY